MKRLALLPLVLFAACGGGGDSSEDNRICIVNDSFNDNSDNSDNHADNSSSTPLAKQIEEAGLAKTTAPGGQVAICGTNTAIDAAIQNAEAPQLSDFLTTGAQQ